jgi:organic radical activating enzyme
MQESTPNGKHMTFETFQNALKFAVRCTTHQGVVMLSGGEPLEHPQFMDFLKSALIHLRERTVYLATNGVKLNNEKLCDDILKLLDEHKWFNIQITAVPSLYPKAKEGADGYKLLINKAKASHINLDNRVNFVNELVHGIISVGRARTSQSPEVLRRLDDNRQGTSCFNIYSALIGNGKPYNLINAIRLVKANVKSSSCKPLIKDNGDISLGEYETCSIVGNVNTIDDSGVIELTGHALPCLRCVTNQTQIVNVTTHILSKIKKLEEQ